MVTKVGTNLPILKRQDATVERWLQEEVAPVYDAMKASPERKHSAKSVFSEVRARHAAKRDVEASSSP